ncbi:MAG: hypothetical protein WC516_05375 [Patescibacteria group bacterium]|jgi:hypothetical protein
MNKDYKSYEVVIGEIQTGLDKDYSDYQRLHKKFYLEEDLNVKLIYRHKTDMLKDILKRIELYERN